MRFCRRPPIVYSFNSSGIIDHNVVLNGHNGGEWYEHEPAILPVLDAVQLPVRPNSHVFQFTSLDIKGEIIQLSQHHAFYVNYLLSGNAPREHLPHSCLTALFSSFQSSHQIEN